MPELPEVEVTRRGLAPYLIAQKIEQIVLHRQHLRWPISPGIVKMRGLCVQSVRRRSKYLLLDTHSGSAIFHLGMSGTLRVEPCDAKLRKHDHVVFVLAQNLSIRFNDPRRFGALLWTDHDPMQHRLLASLGPEPLGDDFNSDYLIGLARNRRCTIKNLLMDGRALAGVGNIYANEALYLAGVHPARPAGALSADQCVRLVDSVRKVLRDAIEAGGTTLQDFFSPAGQAGYFSQVLHVYGRDGQPCSACGTLIERRVIGQRSSFFCKVCQGEG